LKKSAKDIKSQLAEGRESLTINIYSSASLVPTSTYKTNEITTEVRAEKMKYDLISRKIKKAKEKLLLLLLHIQFKALFIKRIIRIGTDIIHINT